MIENWVKIEALEIIKKTRSPGQFTQQRWVDDKTQKFLKILAARHCKELRQTGNGVYVCIYYRSGLKWPLEVIEEENHFIYDIFCTVQSKLHLLLVNYVFVFVTK